MATTKPPVLVVLQLSGGNDYMNTVVPYKDPLYWDYRPRVALPEDQILLLDNDVASGAVLLLAYSLGLGVGSLSVSPKSAPRAKWVWSGTAPRALS